MTKGPEMNDLLTLFEEMTATASPNRGTGAGGAKTNANGKQFEDKTDNSLRLLSIGYKKNKIEEKNKSKFNYYLSKSNNEKSITFVSQSGFKFYVKNRYDINVFRYPDESYIVEYASGRNVIKILEKKEQNVNGSAETKLWSSPSLKREYELIFGEDFEIQYCLCINGFLQNLLKSDSMKYVILNKILAENNINILFGDEDDYFKRLSCWINE